MGTRFSCMIFAPIWFRSTIKGLNSGSSATGFVLVGLHQQGIKLDKDCAFLDDLAVLDVDFLNLAAHFRLHIAEDDWSDIAGRIDGFLAADIDPRTRGLMDVAIPGQSVGVGHQGVGVLGGEVADAVLEGVRSNTTQARYEEVVELAKEDIRAGEVFQVVISQRFSLDCPADPLEVYRALRASNPSPYMYLFRFPAPDGSSYAVVGSSPEAHLYLPKHKGFPPITAIVTFREGRVQMENKLSNSTHTLASGNKLQIGDLWIEIQTDTK